MRGQGRSERRREADAPDRRRQSGELPCTRRNFRLFAATGHPDCQVRLGKLLLAVPERRERDYVQAIAWLKLAADQGQAEARELVEQESPQLTPEQVSAALRLKAQMVHKP